MWILTEIKQKNRNKGFYKVFIVLMIISILSWYYYYSKIKWEKKVFEKEATVQKQDIFSSISSDWKVYYKEQYDLSFQTSGTLQKLFKKEWDEVKAWEAVAKLDDKYLKINLDKAKISLENARASLNAKLASKWQKEDINISVAQLDSSKTTLDTNIRQWNIDVKSAENNLESIKKSLENAKVSREKELEIAKKNLESKQKDLENAKSNLDTVLTWENLNINNSLENAKNVIDSTLPQIEKYLRDIDLILWISNENKYVNDSFESYLWAKNTWILSLAMSNYSLWMKSVEDFKQKLISYDENNAKSYTEDLINISQSVSQNLQNTREVLKNSLVAWNLTQTNINSMISSMELDINSISNDINKLSQTKQSIDNYYLSLDSKNKNNSWNIESLEILVKQAENNLEKIEIQTKTSTDDLEQKLLSAEISLEQAKVKLQNSIDLWNSQINISKANLDYKKSSFDYRELEPYYASIKNAEKSVEEANARLEDSVLKSPINWKLWKLNIKKEWSIVNQNSVFAVIINKNSLYIEVKIEESDISKIKLNWDCKLTFNSLEDYKIEWKVSFISDKSEIDQNGIVSYKVEVSFENKDKKVKEWFTSQIYFITKKLNNSLVLPIEAIKTENWVSEVNISETEKKVIETGIDDWDFVEIKSWLKEWEKVVY